MIFLTVGNWKKGFDRLVREIDTLVEQEVLKGEVITQVGDGSYQPRYMNSFTYCSPDDFTNYISQASLVISHAGVGTIGMVLKQKKPLIVVPRKAQLGEVYNNHQFATARQLEAEGKILVAYETSQLPDRIIQAENFVPNPEHGSEKLIHAVTEFIDKLAETRYA